MEVRRGWQWIAAVFGASVGLQVAWAGEDPGNIGSRQCAECHIESFELWQASDHSRAWTLPSDDSVLAPFAGESFRQGARFFRRNGRFWLHLDETGNDYEIQGVVGVDPLQQYLVQTRPDRLQVLDLAWNVDAESWYSLYPDETAKPGDGRHWSGPYKSWDGRCAECHATAFVKIYDDRTDSYASEQAERGVGCEACHGPGEAHLDWTRDSASFQQEKWNRVDDLGLTRISEPTPLGREINRCATCHSRRAPLDKAMPTPDTAFHERYRLSLIEPGLYQPDGQILDEVYVLGSFLQSAMFDKGGTLLGLPRSAFRNAQGTEQQPVHSMSQPQWQHGIPQPAKSQLRRLVPSFS